MNNITSNSPSTLQDNEEIKKLKQEQKERGMRQTITECQAKLCELDKVKQRAVTDEIYDRDIKARIQQAVKKVKDDYNKLFVIQNQNDVEVGIDVLEVEDFYDMDARSNSGVRMTFEISQEQGKHKM